MEHQKKNKNENLEENKNKIIKEKEDKIDDDNVIKKYINNILLIASYFYIKYN